jgi:hypothetical protein
LKAFVIGGTEPTGPDLVNGLITLDYDVSIMYRGTHDGQEIQASVERVINPART